MCGQKERNNIPAESENESEIPEKDKCCVCKLYTPKEVRESDVLIFIQLVGCDKCSHLVHSLHEGECFGRETNFFARIVKENKTEMTLFSCMSVNLMNSNLNFAYIYHIHKESQFSIHN